MISDERVIRALQAAFDRMRDHESVFGIQLRAQLTDSSGLSPEMIEWALRTSLPADVGVLRDALAKAPDSTSTDVRLAVILSGNVFTACIRALGWPLLLGCHVTAKASSQDDVLPRAFCAALRDADAEVGDRLQVSTFDRTDDAALTHLLSSCNAVSVYGSDETIDSVRGACADVIPVIAHGHGVGAIVVARSALVDSGTIQAWAKRAALDISAYDQRGCLSPHVLWVEAASARDFATALAAELDALSTSLPRGSMPPDVAIAQSRWRGIHASCAELIEGASFAVAFDPPADVDPLSPGHRNVTVRACDNEAALWSALTPLGVHLKVLGVAGDDAAVARVAAAVPTSLRPLVTTVGQMQTPTFDSPADGEPPWSGLR